MFNRRVLKQGSPQFIYEMKRFGILLIIIAVAVILLITAYNIFITLLSIFVAIISSKLFWIALGMFLIGYAINSVRKDKKPEKVELEIIRRL